jgi:hypothetical protein
MVATAIARAVGIVAGTALEVVAVEGLDLAMR